MKILILSDIHGNLPAIEAVLNSEKRNYDSLVCLGDVVNYGPWSNECVEYLQAYKPIVLKGNHETYFIEGHCDSKNEVCKHAFEMIFPEFKCTEVIRQYSDEIEISDFTFIHTIEGKYIYSENSKININRNYFIGHSHRQFLIANNDYKLYNVGSVGQNRNNIHEINYAIYNTDRNEVELKAISYNIKVLLKEFEVQKFPQVVIDYYKSKM